MVNHLLKRLKTKILKMMMNNTTKKIKTNNIKKNLFHLKSFSEKETTILLSLLLKRQLDKTVVQLLLSKRRQRPKNFKFKRSNIRLIIQKKQRQSRRQLLKNCNKCLHRKWIIRRKRNLLLLMVLL
jgi:hypothetical protein